MSGAAGMQGHTARGGLASQGATSTGCGSCTTSKVHVIQLCVFVILFILCAVVWHWQPLHCPPRKPHSLLP